MTTLVLENGLGDISIIYLKWQLWQVSCYLDKSYHLVGLIVYSLFFFYSHR